jgi:RNase P/RNase MRP subunit p30
MFQDICFPKNNEKEFVEVAIKLGTKALIFVYDFKDMKTFEAQKNELLKIKEIKAGIGILSDEKSINRLPDTDDYVFVKTAAKHLIEQKKSYILYDFEEQAKNDFLHHRNSGLNHVMCQIMKEKGKIIGVSFSALLNARSKGLILGRMQQNARLSKKFKLKIIIASFAKTPYELRAEHEIKSFEKIIGL